MASKKTKALPIKTQPQPNNKQIKATLPTNQPTNQKNPIFPTFVIKSIQMANGHSMLIPKFQNLLWSYWDYFRIREEWRKNMVKRSVCHKTNPLYNISMILWSCSHIDFTSVKGRVNIKCRVHWIQKTWDRKTHTTTTSSEWVPCSPNGKKLLNINTSQHTLLITVNYIEPWSSYLGHSTCS